MAEMNRALRVVAAGGVVTALLFGCTGAEKTEGEDAAVMGPPAPETLGIDQETAESEDTAVAEADGDATQSQQIAAVKRLLEGGELFDTLETPSAQHIRRERGSGIEPDPERAESPRAEATESPEAAERASEMAAEVSPPADAAEPAPTRADIAADLAALLITEARGSERPMEQARRLALLAAVAPGEVDAWLEAQAPAVLSPSELDRARTLRTLAKGLAERPEAQLGAVTRAATEALEAQRGLRITRAELCSRASGFGRFTPLAANRFLAGDRKRAVLYLEADAFEQRKVTLENGLPGYEVDLERELRLYHDADGLLAWRRPAEPVVYQTQTKLRDYFMTERVELPRSLSIGKYQLKLVLRDRASGAVAEEILPVEVVADQSLTTAQFRR